MTWCDLLHTRHRTTYIRSGLSRPSISTCHFHRSLAVHTTVKQSNTCMWAIDHTFSNIRTYNIMYICIHVQHTSCPYVHAVIVFYTFASKQLADTDTDTCSTTTAYAGWCLYVGTYLMSHASHTVEKCPQPSFLTMT